MSDKPPGSPQHLRSALDRVLVHDIKNMGFRLQMLLSNIDEHYDDPEFKRSVQELLQSTVERLDGMVERFSAHEDALLIKVALDINGVIREVASGTTRRHATYVSTSRMARRPLLSRFTCTTWGSSAAFELSASSDDEIRRLMSRRSEHADNAETALGVADHRHDPHRRSV